MEDQILAPCYIDMLLVISCSVFVAISDPEKVMIISASANDCCCLFLLI